MRIALKCLNSRCGYRCTRAAAFRTHGAADESAPPDYVCVQTVDRQYFKHLWNQYPPPSSVQIAAFNKENTLDLVLQSAERLRIQLKVSQGRSGRGLMPASLVRAVCSI